MLAKSLVIFISFGVMVGLLFGVYLIDVKNTGQLVYVEGPSISIVTEKFDFKLNEDIKIRVINSGSVPLTFPDASYGLKITGLFGELMYSPTTTQVISTLEPGDEIEFSWDHIKNDGEIVLDGIYRISVMGMDEKGNNVERSTTVTIWK
jgi:hypothetical protein